MDAQRGRSLLGKRSQPDFQQASTAAPTPAELLQLQLAPAEEPVTTAIAAPVSSRAAAGASQGSGSARTAGSSAAAAAADNAGMHKGLWGCSGGAALGLVGVVGSLGGVKLPAQIQDLFVQAAQAAKGGAAAVAPTANLGQIDMAGDDEAYGSMAGPAGAVSAKGVTRHSLSLSLSTPGSAAGVAAGTPATVAGGQQQPRQDEGPSSAERRSGRLSSGAAGLTPGFGEGYTPGSIGQGAASAEHGAAAVDEQQQPGEGMEGQDEEFMDAAGPLDLDDQLQYQDDEVVGQQPAGSYETPGAANRRASQERVPWPADAETLQEQAADGAGEVIASLSVYADDILIC